MLYFCCGAKTIYLSKYIHEVYDRNNSQNLEQQHCLGGEYLIRDYSWQFFFPQQKAQAHENKERMMAGGPIKQCQHVENINQRGGDVPSMGSPAPTRCSGDPRGTHLISYTSSIHTKPSLALPVMLYLYIQAQNSICHAHANGE